MNDRPKRTQPTSPLTWVFLAGLAGIGLYESIKDPPLSPTLEFANQDQPIVVRVSEPSINFPLLGARIELPRDWIYLSTTSPQLSEQPTFFNAQAKAIIRLRPGWNMGWSDQDVQFERQAFEGFEIDWLKPNETITSTAAQLNDLEINVRWRAHQAVRIGRLTKGEINLIVETIAYDRDREPQIIGFFGAIEPGFEG